MTFKLLRFFPIITCPQPACVLKRRLSHPGFFFSSHLMDSFPFQLSRKHSFRYLQSTRTRTRTWALSLTTGQRGRRPFQTSPRRRSAGRPSRRGCEATDGFSFSFLKPLFYFSGLTISIAVRDYCQTNPLPGATAPALNSDVSASG